MLPVGGHVGNACLLQLTQPCQGGGPLSPRCPDVEPGDEGPSRGQGLGAEVFCRPDPLLGPPGLGRAGGLDRGSRPRPSTTRPPAPPSSSGARTQSPFHSTSAAPEVWLTPLRKQTAPGPAGAAGHRGWILPLPAGGRRQADLGSQQPWGKAGPGLLLPRAGWGAGVGALVTWATLDDTLVSGSLSVPGGVVCRLNDTMLPQCLACNTVSER